MKTTTKVDAARLSKDALRKRRARAAGLVKPLPSKPARTVDDELRSQVKAVATRKAKLATLPQGSDDWYRMRVSLQIAEAVLSRCERMVTLCRG